MWSKFFSKKCVETDGAEISKVGSGYSKFRYEIEHIKGEKNPWADLTSRWGNDVKIENEDTNLVRKINIFIPEYVRVRQR